MNQQYCENCCEEVKDEIIVREIEINTVNDGIEIDYPKEIYFCSKECESEYLEDKKMRKNNSTLNTNQLNNITYSE